MLTFVPYFWRVTNLVTNLRIFRVEAGVNGQFRTPRHIIRMMVDLMQPKENDIDKRGLNHYDVLVSDTSTKGSDYYDILCKRYDS